MAEEKRTIIRATREIVVNINGEEYDALLIPRKSIVEVDFSQFPEDDPFRRERNCAVLTEVDLETDEDIDDPAGGIHGKHTFRLTATGAKKLLESL